MDDRSYNAIVHLDNLEIDVKGCIVNKEDFIAFILIMIGIEYLGMFYDSHPFEEPNHSESRFTNALSKLFKGQTYLKNQKLLYKLRGGLFHQYRPSEEVLLTSFCKNGAPTEYHLQKHTDGRLILVVEQFFADFIQAKDKLKLILSRDNPLNKSKPLSDYIDVFSLQGPNLPNPTSVSGIQSTQKFEKLEANKIKHPKQSKKGKQ